MTEEIIALRNYAHLGDAVWEIFVREYVIFKTSNSKILHFISEDLTEEEHELARRGRNLPIPVARRAIQNVYRPSTAFEVLIGYWYLHDKERLNFFYNKIKNETEYFT